MQAYAFVQREESRSVTLILVNTFLISETSMLGCKPAASPIEANYRLKVDDGEQVDRERYQRMAGKYPLILVLTWHMQ